MSVDSVSYASHLASREENPNHLAHIWEFRELASRVAREQIEEVVPQLVNEAVSRAVNESLSIALGRAIQGIAIDVNRIVDITVKDMNKQFHSEEISHFLAETLKAELIKGLSNIDVKLIVS